MQVRLGLITPDYLQNCVISNAVIKDSIECIPIIDDAVTAIMDFRANRGSKVVYSNLLTRPRLPSAILLATGGKDGSSAVTSLEAYDARADCWVTVSTEKICCSDHGAAVLNNFVYLIGGSLNEIHLNTVQRFDLITCTWNRVAPMNYCRRYVSVAVQNGCIYAMGGYNGHAFHNTVERYKPEADQWTMMAPMRTKRCGAGSATLNGKVGEAGMTQTSKDSEGDVKLIPNCSRTEFFPLIQTDIMFITSLAHKIGSFFKINNPHTVLLQ